MGGSIKYCRHLTFQPKILVVGSSIVVAEPSDLKEFKQNHVIDAILEVMIHT
jgi:hypothetical protein